MSETQAWVSIWESTFQIFGMVAAIFIGLFLIWALLPSVGYRFRKWRGQLTWAERRDEESRYSCKRLMAYADNDRELFEQAWWQAYHRRILPDSSLEAHMRTPIKIEDFLEAVDELKARYPKKRVRSN